MVSLYPPGHQYNLVLHKLTENWTTAPKLYNHHFISSSWAGACYYLLLIKKHIYTVRASETYFQLWFVSNQLKHSIGFFSSSWCNKLVINIAFFTCYNLGFGKPLLFIVLKSQIIILIWSFFNGSGGDKQLYIFLHGLTWR